MSTQNPTAPRRFDTRKLVTMAMLSAIGIVLALAFHTPLIPAAPFLEYDPADIPILIGTMIYGPLAGIMMTVVVSAIQASLASASGVIGFVMHVVATGAMVTVVGLFYRRSNRSVLSSIIALLLGVLTMTVVMTGMNLLLTPIFMGRGVDTVIKMLVPAIIPFNLLKAGINSVIAFLVFRPVGKLVTH